MQTDGCVTLRDCPATRQARSLKCGRLRTAGARAYWLMIFYFGAHGADDGHAIAEEGDLGQMLADAQLDCGGFDCTERSAAVGSTLP